MKTHKEIAALKNEREITKFLSKYQHTEYAPLIPTLSRYLSVCRDRTRLFTWAEHHQLYREFETLLHYCGWVFDRNYDWCQEWDIFPFNSQSTLANEQPKYYPHIQ